MNQADNRHHKTSSKEPDYDTICTWASFCHFSALFGLLWWIPTDSVWIPMGHLAGPAAVWLLRRRVSPLIDAAGKEALTFQVTMSLYAAVCFLLFGRFEWVSYLMIAVVIIDIALLCGAGVRWSRGERHRYPLVFYRPFQ